VPFWTYILQSVSTRGYYCGSTDDLERRLRQHNDPEYQGTKTTKRFRGPWQVVWSDTHATRSAAMMQERQIKNRGIKRFLEAKAQSVESCRGQD